MALSVDSPDDLSTSPLWNPDLAPTTPARRTWSTYDMAALWISMSVVITTYTLASGLMQQGMTWWQAMATILLGNVIVLVPMILNAHAGTRYGIPFQCCVAPASAYAAPMCPPFSARWSPAGGSAFRRGSAGWRSTRC